MAGPQRDSGRERERERVRERHAGSAVNNRHCKSYLAASEGEISDVTHTEEQVSGL